MPGVSSSRYQFIFGWHQGRVLPTPACGITPNTQKSERKTDAVDQGEQEMCLKRKTVIKRERVIMETITSAWADLGKQAIPECSSNMILFSVRDVEICQLIQMQKEWVGESRVGHKEES